jgi:hypothetical protein
VRIVLRTLAGKAAPAIQCFLDGWLWLVNPCPWLLPNQLLTPNPMNVCPKLKLKFEQSILYIAFAALAAIKWLLTESFLLFNC